jgi:phthalate 4,5-dioxygenase oxygenase subunit
MLSVEDNEAITRVGPGTLMGNFMREYWLPGLLSSEVPRPDCDPVRVRLLGEDLIAFRDTGGNVGLIQNLCPHRGTSLFIGRNEDYGIRCVYHGWKFDVAGRCVDMPSEPPESVFKDKVRATAYPCREIGGAVFVYMGQRDVPPPLPRIEAWEAPEGAVTNARQTPCNWLQVMEGNIDTIHAAFLHRGAVEPDWFPEGSFEYYAIKQRWARFEVADTDAGAIYGAYRPGPEGYNYWRIGKFMFPCWSTAAAGVMGYTVGDTCWVPMDDTHTMVFGIGKKGQRDSNQFRPSRRPLSEEEAAEPEVLPNTTDWYGRFRSVYNLENDWLIDRDRQRSFWSFAGMPYVTLNEDRAVQEAMGPILPREIEHLGTTDKMVIRVRQRLLQAARAVANKEIEPPAVDTPDVYLGRVGQVMIPEGADWLEYTEKFRAPFVEHPPLDPILLAGSSKSPNGTRYVRHTRSGPMF